MIAEDVIIVGKVSFALSIILDMLIDRNCFNVAIVPNIPDIDNDSLLYDFSVKGVETKEYEISELKDVRQKMLIIGSIGRSRKAIFDSILEYVDPSINDFTNLFHKASIRGSKVRLGKGIHLGPLSVIAPYAEIGDFAVINRNASIGHHTKLGKFVTINPGVNIAGICNIGNYSSVGIGATVIDGITIGENTKVGAGSLVTKDLPEGVIAYGSPAIVIRPNPDLNKK